MAIVAGAGFGLLEALATLGKTSGDLRDMETIENRLDAIEDRMASAVTSDELSQSVESTLERLEKLMEVRLEQQSRSIEALHVMIGQTDELLQRVLDGLESAGDEPVSDDEAPLRF